MEADWKCGRKDPEGFGFHHMFDTQLAEGTDMQWEELADMAISVATENRPIIQNNGNWCYTSQLTRYVKQTGQIVGTYWFVVIFDAEHDSIVTTFPRQAGCDK